jgi:DNA methylase/Type I restriction enzyme R protein N terminus (HSDR_N)
MQHIFRDFDFDDLNSPDFKEDSVRELLILPILNELGYGKSKEAKIHRSKSVTHSFVQTGSGKHPLKSVPDYLLEVDGKYAWVLDAKGPNEEIKTGDNRQQAFFYAIHPEINVPYYALCNGKEFVLFAVNSDDAMLHFSLSEIDKHVGKIERILSPDSFRKNKFVAKLAAQVSPTFEYLSRKPLDEIKRIRKQSAKRHFGVHGYFTKQAFEILQKYIENFTKPGDMVLDPFGGTGVTLIESLLLGRKAVHIDLNPLSVFWVKTLVEPTNFGELVEEFGRIEKQFERNRPTTEEELDATLKRYDHPKGIRLPKSSDVEVIEDLFTKQQLGELALLKNLIKQVKDKNIQNQLLF